MTSRKIPLWMIIGFWGAILLLASIACQWSDNSTGSSAPEGQAQDIAYLRSMAYTLYTAASHQDIASIVRLMDVNDVSFHRNCEDLANGFSQTSFELTGIDMKRIQVTIFPQTDADKQSGIRRAWTRTFTAKISVNGSQPSDIELGQDKFINRGGGWKLAGFYINKNDIGLPYPFSCGRFSNSDWH